MRFRTNSYDEWLAFERGRNDKSLLGFWPLLRNRKDYSGSGAHPLVVQHDGNNLWQEPANKGFRVNQLGGRPCYTPMAGSTGGSNDGACLVVTPSMNGHARFDRHRTSHFTLACWVYLTGFQPTDPTNLDSPSLGTGIFGVWGYESLSYKGWHLSYTSDYLLRAGFESSSTVYKKSKSKLPLERWTHVALTYSGDENGIRIYIDGHEETSPDADNTSPSPFLGVLFNEFTPVAIGGRWTDDYNMFEVMKGGINLVRLYNRVLGRNELVTLINREREAFSRHKAYVGMDLPPTATMTFFMQAYDTDTLGNTLFISGDVHEQMPLFTKGIDSANSNIPLFIDGVFKQESTLFIQGYDTPEPTGMSLFIDADPVLSTTLHMHGHSSADPSGAPLYVLGHEVDNSGASLLISGIEPLTRGMNLVLATDVIPSSNLSADLFVWGTTEAGMRNVAPLYMYSDESGNVRTRNMPLSIHGIHTGTATRNMNMVVHGKAHDASDSMSMVLHNEGSDGLVELFIQGDGVTDGAMPLGNDMNLYINKLQGNVAPLYLHSEPPDSGLMTLFIDGTFGETAELTLALPEAIGSSTKNAKLFTHGF